jgi:hypothetical protein
MMWKWNAFSLGELIRNNADKPNQRAKNCEKYSVSGYRRVSGEDRYLFYVRCYEKWSDPRGHIVTVNFDMTPKEGSGKTQFLPNRSATDTDMNVFCHCPAYHYWGSEYIATQLDYILSGHSENRFPKIRDPQLNNLVCKHVALVGTEILAHKSLYDVRNINSKKSTDYEATLREYIQGVPMDITETFDSIRAFLTSHKAEESKIEELISGIDRDNYLSVLKAIGMTV